MSFFDILRWTVGIATGAILLAIFIGILVHVVTRTFYSNKLEYLTDLHSLKKSADTGNKPQQGKQP